MKLSRKGLAAIRNRWTTAQNEEIANAIHSGELARVTLPKFEFDGVSYLDLRGIHIDRFIHNANLQDVDLSYSTPKGIGGEYLSRLTNCRLIGVNLGEGVLAANCYRCDMSFSKFKEMCGHFDRCKFRECNLSRVEAVQLHFIGCDFTSANLYNTHYLECIFDNCIWDGCKLGMGSFGRSKFIGTMPSKDELGETIMDDVTFEP